MTLLSGRARVIIDSLKGSYWLVPALMVSGALALSLATSHVDRWAVPDTTRPWGRWMSTAGPDGARSVLSTIAASMITLASLTYSLTLIALTLAAGQYGPRLLRTFMRDRVTQVGLGAFLATFAFCLAALRDVGTDANPTVPHASVAVAMGMAGLCLAYLVYFIHHVSSSINATSVVETVNRELMACIGTPETKSNESEDTPVPDAPGDATPVPSRSTGYVTMTDMESLVGLADEHDAEVWLAVRAGDFIIVGEPLAYVRAAGPLSLDAVHRAINLAPERTMLQDTEFGVAQLVEVALRALSPGINDPFTAILCIDMTGAALVALSAHPPSTRIYRGQNGVARVTRLRVPTFDGVLRAAFDPLRQAARGHVGVLVRLAEALGRIAQAARTTRQRDAVRRQLDMIATSARESVPEARDQQDILDQVHLSETKWH